MDDVSNHPLTKLFAQGQQLYVPDPGLVQDLALNRRAVDSYVPVIAHLKRYPNDNFAWELWPAVLPALQAWCYYVVPDAPDDGDVGIYRSMHPAGESVFVCRYADLYTFGKEQAFRAMMEQADIDDQEDDPPAAEPCGDG